ncbi:MAG: carboxypeptidase-like regulatory domain-containing protein [Acidobacteriia bacterium]|nr:carboxypeptidase-like regulatory domain-containing protein [Terriglobia bacterium]
MPFSGIARIALAALGLGGVAAAQEAILTGRVVDENDAPLDHARVTARRGQGAPLEAYSGPSGQFRIALPAPGTYLLGAFRPGYFELKDRPVDVPAGGTEVTLALNVEQEVFQAVQVGALPDLVDPDQTQREQRLSGTVVNNVPYPASHSLRNAMKLIPGVVQDPSGGLHFHGGAEYQTQYMLDGFDITDPIDGRYSTRLAVEGVRSLDLLSSRETPQYGRGSAGTLEINTENGTDQFRYTATNFIPGLDYRGGLRFGDWTPPPARSGPPATCFTSR